MVDFGCGSRFWSSLARFCGLVVVWMGLVVAVWLGFVDQWWCGYFGGGKWVSLILAVGCGCDGLLIRSWYG